MGIWCAGAMCVGVCERPVCRPYGGCVMLVEFGIG